MSFRWQAISVALASIALSMAPEARQQSTPTFASRTSGVRLDVSVFDGPAAVHGLETRNFELTDNKVRQLINVVETRDAPLDVVLVIQPLASLSDERQRSMKGALQGLASLFSKSDRVALVSATAGPDVTRPLVLLDEGLSRPALLTGTEGVAVRDALLRAFLLFDTADRRKSVIVFTDGRRDQSWVTASGVEMAALAQPAQVLIAALDSMSSVTVVATATDAYGRTGTDISSYTKPSDLSLPPYLSNLARTTGGRIVDFRVGDAGARLSELLSYLRSQYVITYSPTNPTPGWHQVNLRLIGTRGHALMRAGYWLAPGTSP
jgi:VWFA-related protein